MLKYYWYDLKFKSQNYYFSRIKYYKDYDKSKIARWNDQLNKSFKSDKFYKNKKSFFKKYLTQEHLEYLLFLKKNLKKNKKILSIGSGRGATELKLLDLGYNITLSDIQYPSGLKDQRKIFKNIKYIKFDIFKDKIKNKYDYIICLNLIYAFNERKCEEFFKNSKKILKNNGSLIISPGGSLKNLIKLFYNNIYLPLETYIFYLYFNCINKNVSILKFHHGYIYSNQMVIDIAKKFNFRLYKDVFKGDFITEFQRSKIIPVLIKKSYLMKKIFKLIGKNMPFVNIFFFKKH